MLTSIEVRTTQGGLLTLPLEDVDTGYLVRDISGLDPVKATIVTTSFATQDGASFQSSRRDTRNIVLTLGLEPDYATNTATSLRSRLYAYFMPKSSVSMTYVSDDMPDVVISGTVESFTAPPFTKDPTVIVSIICVDPDFVDQTPVPISGNSVSAITSMPLVYNGTVETGFVFNLTINRADVSAFSLINIPPDGIQRNMDVAVANPFLVGDVLTINTNPGSKGVFLNRGGSQTSLLYALSPYSDWIQLFAGVNNIRVSAPGNPLAYTIQYFNRYGGL